MWIKKQLAKLLIWLTEDAIKQKVNNFIRADKDLSLEMWSLKGCEKILKDQAGLGLDVVIR